jgi:biotin operon repressor
MSHGMNFVWTDEILLDVLWRWDGRRQSAGVIATTLGITRNAVLGAVHRAIRAGQAFDWEALADCTLLAVLDEFHGRGTPAEVLGRRLGQPRMAVLHMIHCLRVDAARAEAPGPFATRPGKRNGDLPLGWWAARAGFQGNLT